MTNQLARKPYPSDVTDAQWEILAFFSYKVLPHLPHLGNIFRKDLALWVLVLVGLLPGCALFSKLIEEPGIRLGAWLVTRLSDPRRFLPAGAIFSRLPRAPFLKEAPRKTRRKDE